MGIVLEEHLNVSLSIIKVEWYNDLDYLVE